MVTVIVVGVSKPTVHTSLVDPAPQTDDFKLPWKVEFLEKGTLHETQSLLNLCYTGYKVSL